MREFRVTPKFLGIGNRLSRVVCGTWSEDLMIILWLPPGLRTIRKYKRRGYQGAEPHKSLARRRISTPDKAREIGQFFFAFCAWSSKAAAAISEIEASVSRSIL